jgi:hypothetical protein
MYKKITPTIKQSSFDKKPLQKFNRKVRREGARDAKKNKKRD